jgi:hypothetical protein
LRPEVEGKLVALIGRELELRVKLSQCVKLASESRRPTAANIRELEAEAGPTKKQNRRA